MSWANRPTRKFYVCKFCLLLHHLLHSIILPCNNDAYPLRPLRAILSVNCFCVKKYRTKIGIRVMNDPAMTKCTLLPSSEIKFRKPTAIGRQVSELVTKSGQASAFQVPTKENTIITMMGAVESGKTTCMRKRKCPAPSIRAASNSSWGIWAKNCRKRKMENMRH